MEVSPPGKSTAPNTAIHIDIASWRHFPQQRKPFCSERPPSPTAVPAKAGTYSSDAQTAERWVPAFAGTTVKANAAIAVAFVHIRRVGVGSLMGGGASDERSGHAAAAHAGCQGA